MKAPQNSTAILVAGSLVVLLGIGLWVSWFSAAPRSTLQTGVTYFPSVSIPTGGTVIDDQFYGSSWIDVSTIKSYASGLVQGNVLGIVNVTVTPKPAYPHGYWIETYFAFNVTAQVVGQG
ncbi:MAG: hypothetical protein ACLP9K_00675 [Nitrososphaerales archaeon]